MASPPLKFTAPSLGSESATLAQKAESNGAAAVYLHPAQMHVATAPCAIKTLLGSCVAVCLWDAEARVGGVVHYLLPQGREGRAETGRYGNLAIPALIRATCALGGSVGALKAKIFGGAKVLPGLKPVNGPSLGDSNIAAARELLAAQNVPVVASDVGGERGRRLLFHVEDGSAWVWRLTGP